MQSSFLLALANTKPMRKFGAVVTTATLVLSSLSPLAAYAAATVVIDTINGVAPTGHCIAGPVTIVVHGIRGSNGGPYSIVVGNGISTSTPVSAGSGANGAFSNVSISYTPAGSSNSLYLNLFHGSQSGSDAHLIVVQQCVAAPTQGVVTVVKHVENGATGRTNVAGDFTLHISTNSFAGSETGTDNLLAAGPYTVSEGSVAGYVGTFSGDCDSSGNVTVVAGNNYTCTLTNTATDQTPGTLHVIKHVINDEPEGQTGTKVASDFTITVENGAPGTFAGSEDGTTVTIPGNASFNVTENADAAYSSSFDGTCSGTMTPGGEITCTITNNDNPATTGGLTVVKVMNNIHGGTAVATDFTYHVGATTVLSGVSNQFAGGVYVVTETDGPAGYTAAFSGDCDSTGNVTVVNGISKTCTITNTDSVATITIVKNATGANGAFNFVIGQGDALVPVSLTTVAGTAQSDTSVNAGTYDVTESVPTGWTMNSVDCGVEIGTGISNGMEVTIAANQHITCTFTNTATGADLSMTKTVDNVAPITGDTVTYTLAVHNAGPASASNVSALDVLPAGLTYVSDDGAGAYVSGTGVWTIGTLASGADATLHIVATVTAEQGTEIANDATVSTSDESVSDFNTSNNNAESTITVGAADVCPNLDGLQTEVPEGMQLTGGQCVPQTSGGGDSTTDICPNLDGVQTSVPSGMHKEVGLCLADAVQNTGGGGGGGGGGGNGPIVGSYGGATGQVLGVSTSTINFGVACERYLTAFIKQGQANDPLQVARLQLVLKAFEGANLTLNGIYDDATLAAVHQLQTKYSADILMPWGLDQSTGFVYLTTRKKVNELYCKNTVQFPLTAEEQAIVDSYKASGAGHKPAPVSTGDASTNSGSTNTNPGTGATNSDSSSGSENNGTTGSEGQAGAVGTAVTSTSTSNGGGVWGAVGSFFSNLFRGK